MSIKDIQKTHILYTIEVTVEDMLKILDYDGGNKSGLFNQLDNIEGVDNTDYDGLLGPNIFLSIEHQDDNLETWTLIKKTINQVI